MSFLSVSVSVIVRLMEKCLFCDGVTSRGRWRTPTCTDCDGLLKNALRSRRDLWDEKALGKNNSAYQNCIICGPRSRIGDPPIGCPDAQRSVCQWCVTEQAAHVQKGCVEFSVTFTPTNCSDWARFLSKYDPTGSVKPATKKARTSSKPATTSTPSSSNLDILADSAEITKLQQVEEQLKEFQIQAAILKKDNEKIDELKKQNEEKIDELNKDKEQLKRLQLELDELKKGNEHLKTRLHTIKFERDSLKSRPAVNWTSGLYSNLNKPKELVEFEVAAGYNMLKARHDHTFWDSTTRTSPIEFEEGELKLLQPFLLLAKLERDRNDGTAVVKRGGRNIKVKNKNNVSMNGYRNYQHSQSHNDSEQQRHVLMIEWSDWRDDLPIEVLGEYQNSTSWANGFEKMILGVFRSKLEECGVKWDDDWEVLSAHTLNQKSLTVKFRWHQDTEDSTHLKKVMWTIVIALEKDQNSRIAGMQVAGWEPAKYEKVGDAHLFDADYFHSTEETDAGGIKVGIFVGLRTPYVQAILEKLRKKKIS